MQYPIYIDVAPFLINDNSQKTARAVGKIIDSFDRKLEIVDYIATDSGILILIKGNIGNKFDDLLRDLRAVAESKLIDDELASEIMSSLVSLRYPDLNKHLLCAFS